MFLAVVLLAGAFIIEAGAALKPINVVDENNKETDVIDYKATVNQYLDSANLFTKDEEKLAKMIEEVKWEIAEGKEKMAAQSMT